MAEAKKVSYDVTIYTPGISRNLESFIGVLDRALSITNAIYRLIEIGFQSWMTYNHYKVEQAKLAYGVNLEAVKLTNQARYEQLKAEGKLVNLWLAQTGPNKIQVIKAIRNLTHLGLREAKDIVDRAPCLMWPNVAPDQVEEFIKAVSEVGGVVEIRSDDDQPIPQSRT